MVEDRNNHIYDDIIHLKNPTSKNHPRMSIYDRAAQFSPFAAVVGHEAAIRETARVTDKKQELSEEMIIRLNEQLNMIAENIDAGQTITITYFVPDVKKSGGVYRSHSGVVKKVDPYDRTIIFADKTVIHIEQISKIEGELFLV